MDNQKKKIVIIDDEISFLNIFETLLKNAGSFEIKTFSNPKTAVKEIVEEKPDLILLDVSMPEMDGFEVFECLKKDLCENVPKIIFLTNLGETVNRDAIDEQYAKNIGAQGYIRKTEDLNKILQKIKEVLG